MGCSPWGHKESDTTVRLSTHTWSFDSRCQILTTSVCICVCVCEKERERDGGWGGPKVRGLKQRFILSSGGQKFEIKVSALLVSSEGLSPWLIDGHLLPASSHGPSGLICV